MACLGETRHGRRVAREQVEPRPLMPPRRPAAGAITINNSARKIDDTVRRLKWP